LTVKKNMARAFTLIELLVVIAIIGTLAALLLPALFRSLSSGRGATCAQNAHQIAVAFKGYEADHGYLPWRTMSFWKQITSPKGNTSFGPGGSWWMSTLGNAKYLPTDFKRTVWRCPEVRQAEIDAQDSSGWTGGVGGYGALYNLLQTEYDGGSNKLGKVRSENIARPAYIWLVGDVGHPVAGSTPGEGRYMRTNHGFSRPSAVGAWSFSGTPPPTQPALRHNNLANWAALDGHVTKMDWNGMKNEVGNFTGRGEF
jgi:prepilin-type N-terminal cleavage/methylation domain-containing protein/prepilin-type processing-associated H-X9-DG protein